MVSGSHTEVVTSSVGVERLWKTILDGENLIPKLMSHVVSNVEIITGDGGVGTVKKFYFAENATPFKFITEKTEVLDHENHIFKYTVVDGGLIGISLKSTSFEFKFEGRGDGGCTGHLTMWYETIEDADLTGEEKSQVFKGVLEIVKAVEGYLTANSEAYL